MIIREKEKEIKEKKKHEKTLIRRMKKLICTMSFSVHFRFIEKNPPDFFLPVAGAC
jgi:fructose-1,6-bisphosphatase